MHTGRPAELDKGMCEGPYDAAMLDAMYGTGNVRLVRRFLILQGDGKSRVCDNMAECLVNDGSSCILVHGLQVQGL